MSTMTTPGKIGALLVGWGSGAVLATIVYFGTRPFLTERQRDVFGWLVSIASFAVIVVVVLRARRNADQGPSS